jgi:hypothetical protein
LAEIKDLEIFKPKENQNKPMCVERKMITFSVLLGLVITVATSLFVNTYVIGEFPNIRFVSLPIVGVGYWGLPLPWMKQIVYPGAVKEIMWTHFIVDAIFWIGAVLVVKMSYLSMVKGKKPKKRPKRAIRKTKPKRTRPMRRAFFIFNF